jgi:cytochrome P450
MTAFTSEIEGVTALLDGDQTAIQAPELVWDRLLAEAPVYRDGERVVLSRYEDVRAAQQDSSGNYGKNVSRTSYLQRFLATLSPQDAEDFYEFFNFRSVWMVSTTGEEHARLRRIAHRAFTPRRIAEMQAVIQRYTNELIAPLEQDVADFMQVAYRLPLMVIVDMLGCPPEDRELIHAWSRAIGAQQDRADVVTLRAAATAVREFRRYVHEAVAAQRKTGAGERDLVAALLEAHDGEQLTEEELVGMFVMLLFAGHETTTNLIAIGLADLLRSPDQWRLLCSNRDLIPNAVEELLRLVSPVQWTKRRAVKEHVIGGITVAPDTMIVLSNAAANRDPAAFADPQRLDIARPDSRRHLALGFGAQFCLGASLARLEASIVFSTITSRFPDLTLATDDLTFVGSSALRTLRELPVHLGIDRGADTLAG